MAAVPPELPPEEIMALAESAGDHPGELMKSAEFASSILMSEPGMLAGIMFAWQDAIHGNCQCPPCTALRNTAGSVLLRLPDGDTPG